MARAGFLLSREGLSYRRSSGRLNWEYFKVMQPSTRKIVTRSPSRTVRIINLRGILDVPVEAESSLEADYVLRSAFGPGKKKIIHQPFKLPVSPKGYTPDFLEETEEVDEKAVVEVKLEKRVAKYADLFDRAAEYLLPRNYKFYVLTEKHLRRDGIEERVRLLRRYAKAVFPAAERKRALDTLSGYPQGLAIGSLMRKARVSRELIVHLIAWKLLFSGHGLQLAESAIVILPNGASQDASMTLESWFGVAPWGAAR